MDESRFSEGMFRNVAASTTKYDGGIQDYARENIELTHKEEDNEWDDYDEGSSSGGEESGEE